MTLAEAITTVLVAAIAATSPTIAALLALERSKKNGKEISGVRGEILGIKCRAYCDGTNWRA